MMTVALILAILSPDGADKSLRSSVPGITVTVRQAVDRDPQFAPLRWDYDEFNPNLAVRRIDLAVNGKVWLTPLSAYSDLANVRQVGVRRQSGAVVVLLSGADAGGSWGGRLVYRSGFLTRREVWSGEFPDYDREVTVYTIRTPPE